MGATSIDGNNSLDLSKKITTRKRQKKGFIYALQHDEEMTTSFRFKKTWDTFFSRELNGSS
jgi:hypothetical protein